MSREERRFQTHPLKLSGIPASLAKQVCSTRSGREEEAAKEQDNNAEEHLKTDIVHMLKKEGQTRREILG